MRTLAIMLFGLWASLCHAQTWLSFPAATGYVTIGDLDVPGTQLTVECLYTSTNAASVDLVSKHASPADVNYLLRRTHAELSTTSGFISTPSTCPPDENTCRHAAMVYNGSTLSFYLNGQLNGQVPMTGNMILNNYQTMFGNYACCFGGEQFFGFMNEVRIWNVARSQAQIQSFMFTSLPSPPTQVGLQAYYIFNSLTNLQGNATWNGSMAGTASIGAVNPMCPGLSPLCVILGNQFDRFTLTPAAGGLRFDWIWNGELPSHYLLEAGPEPHRCLAIQRIDARQDSHRLAPLPRENTWFRLGAVLPNGEAVYSNAVEYTAPLGDRITLMQVENEVQVVLPQPTHALWRWTDLAGRLLGTGESMNTSFMIPLPTATQGWMVLEVVADGKRHTLKCQPR